MSYKVIIELEFETYKPKTEDIIKYINQILINYFNDEVKDMTNEEFAEHLKNLNWEIGE